MKKTYYFNLRTQWWEYKMFRTACRDIIVGMSFWPGRVEITVRQK